MPNPRRKFSKTRSRKRYGQERVHTMPLKPCPQCYEPRIPHRVCPKCGYYAERSVLPAKEE